MIPGWLEEIEDEVLNCLRTRGSISVQELAEALGVSERCATSYVTLLAFSERILIERVRLPEARRAARAA